MPIMRPVADFLSGKSGALYPYVSGLWHRLRLGLRLHDFVSASVLLASRTHPPTLYIIAASISYGGLRQREALCKTRFAQGTTAKPRRRNRHPPTCRKRCHIPAPQGSKTCTLLPCENLQQADAIRSSPARRCATPHLP